MLGYSFLAGLGVALATGLMLRIVVGFRLRLYLVNRESLFQDQGVIPVTDELRKWSFWRTIFSGKWKEDVEMVLLDDQDQPYSVRFSYHPWKRFLIKVDPGPGSVYINGKPVKRQVPYSIRTGMILEVGDRAFTFLVSPIRMTHEFAREFISLT